MRLVCEIDRRILPHAAAERLVGIADLGELLLLGLDVAMHVAAGRVVLRPYADRIFRGRVEGPEQLAVLGVIGLHEAADAVFAPVRADQDFALHDRRRHRLAVAELGIGDVGLPDLVAGLGVERDQLGIERRRDRPCLRTPRRRDCSGRSNRS